MISGSDRPVIIVEEHVEAGGLTSILAAACSLSKPKKLYSINLGDRFGESGSPHDLYEKYGFSAKKIAERITQILEL